MSGFSTEWLALREPVDMRARNTDVLDAVAAAFARQGCALDRRSRQRHRLDGSRAERASAEAPDVAAGGQRSGAAGGSFCEDRSTDVAVETVQFDLNDDVGSLFDESAELVTSSALIDLVSEAWMANLAAAVAARRLPVYIALTYDGRVAFSDADPLDEQVVAAVNTHQLGNKGFGPALGPRAADFATRIFRTLGYAIVQGQSDWVADASDAPFQRELLAGWRQAARRSAKSRMTTSKAGSRAAAAGGGRAADP